MSDAPLAAPPIDAFEIGLMQHSSVVLFWRRSLLDDAVRGLRERDYDVMDVDCSTLASFVRGIALALRWEGQFGYVPTPERFNANALDDALFAVPHDSHSRAALVLRDFHELNDEVPDLAGQVLDAVQRRCRDAMLFGQRLVCLVCTEDSSFYTNPLGGRRAVWNSAEWANHQRGRPMHPSVKVGE